MHYDGCHDCWHDLAEVELVAQIRPLVGPHWVNHNCTNLPSIKTIAFGNFWQLFGNFWQFFGNMWQLKATLGWATLGQS